MLHFQRYGRRNRPGAASPAALLGAPQSDGWTQWRVQERSTSMGDKTATATAGANGHSVVDTGSLVKHLIGGQWVESAARGTLESENPATGEKLAELSQGTAEDANRAVEAARKAFDSWRLVPA